MCLKKISMDKKVDDVWKWMVMSEFQSFNKKEDHRWIIFTTDENDNFWMKSINYGWKVNIHAKQWSKLHQLNCHITYLVFTITF